MPIQHIGSLFVPVRKLERSIPFYTDTLGFYCRGIEDWGDGKRGATLFVDPHPEHAALLTLEEAKDSFEAMQRPLFNINCRDAAEMHRELQAKGCRVTELATWDSPWNHHVLFDVFDPDGNVFTLIQMVPLAVKS